MDNKKKLAAPCGLYCGVCAILIAHKDNNIKFKERLTTVYGVNIEDIQCEGCLSDKLYKYCQTCPIRSCAGEKAIEGCHQCNDFPCKFIENFPLPVGKKVILRAIPTWRELGTERWMEEEEKRYHCPHCGYKLFRGTKRYRNCQQPVDVD
jgi:DNA-directed RNA polymerase subunit RPC12/RpoP